MIEFNLSDDTDQKFSTTLNGQRVSIRIRYNPTNDRWSFDLSLDGNAVLHGRKIIPGTDLLKAYNFGIGAMFAFSDKGSIPNRDNLPLGLVKLYHTTEDEINAAISS